MQVDGNNILYVVELYRGEDKPPEVPVGSTLPVESPSILEEKIEIAVKELFIGKAVGTDEIPAEILKRLRPVGKRHLGIVCSM